MNRTSTSTAEPFDEIARVERRHGPDLGWTSLRAEPVRREPDGRWVVSGYEEVRQLLSDPRVSSTPAPAGGPALRILNSVDAPIHEQLRRHLMRYFGPPWHARRVEGLTAGIAATTTAQLDALTGRSRMDVVEDFAYHVPVSAICAVLGLPADDHGRFAEWMKPVAAARTVEETGRGIAEAKDLMTPYFTELLQHRRAEPRDDMITGIARPDDRGRLPDDSLLIDNLFLLFVGGHETTINAVSSAILYLLRRPDVEGRVRADPSLIPALFEETLRLQPPAQMFDNRRALADIPVGTAVIPEGARIVLVTAAANRDPRRFPDPDTFDLDRADNQHLSFHGGPHYCFGAPMARLEARIMIGEWLRRVENPRLAVDPVEYRANAALRGPLHLVVDYDLIASA